MRERDFLIGLLFAISDRHRVLMAYETWPNNRNDCKAKFKEQNFDRNTFIMQKEYILYFMFKFDIGNKIPR